MKFNWIGYGFVISLGGYLGFLLWFGLVRPTLLP